MRHIESGQKPVYWSELSIFTFLSGLGAILYPVLFITHITSSCSYECFLCGFLISYICVLPLSIEEFYCTRYFHLCKTKVLILLPSYDLFNTSTATAGYAWLGTVCEGEKASSVVEFDGTYSTVVNTAHEIAHK